MQIVFKNKIREINTKDEVSSFWEELQCQSLEEKEVISQIEIQDQTIYEGFYEALLQAVKLESNISIRIQTNSYDQLMIETTANIKNYIPNILNHIEQIADPFYSEVNQENWQLFIDFLDGLNWLCQAIAGILRLCPNPENPLFMQQYNLFIEHLSTMMVAIEEKDFVTVGDTLLYEIKTDLDKLLVAVNQIVGVNE